MPESSQLATGAFENDPLLCKMELPLREVFYPLGFAVEISINSQAVLDAARESWKNLSQRHSSPMLQIGSPSPGARPAIARHHQSCERIANCSRSSLIRRTRLSAIWVRVMPTCG